MSRNKKKTVCVPLEPGEALTLKTRKVYAAEAGRRCLIRFDGDLAPGRVVQTEHGLACDIDRGD